MRRVEATMNVEAQSTIQMRSDTFAVAELVACYLVASVLGFAAASRTEGIVLLWPAAGIGLVTILLLGYRFWILLALGTFLLALANHHTLGFALGISAGETLEAVIGVMLLRRFTDFDGSLERLENLLPFLLVAGVGAPIVGGLFGAITLCFAGTVPWSDIFMAGSCWWLADALGNIVVAPFILVWKKQTAPLSIRKVLEVGALAGAVIFFIILITYVRLRPGINLGFILFPVGVWAALRFGQRGTTAVTLLVSILVLSGLLIEKGMFFSDRIVIDLALIQVFIAVLSITGLILASILAERAQTQKGLRESVRRYREVFEKSRSMICTHDLEGVLLTINPLGSETLGYQPEEMVGRKLSEFLLPYSAEYFKGEYFKLLRATGVDSGVTYLQTKSGQECAALFLSCVVDEPGMEPFVLCNALDISERMRMEKELNQRMEHLNLLKGAIEQLPLGVTISDQQRKIVFVNSAEASMHGYDPKDLQGLQTNIFGPPELHAPMDPQLIRQFGGWKRETLNIRKDSSTFPVQLASSAIGGPNGEWLGIVTTSEDITLRKQAEETLRNKMAQLEEAEKIAQMGSWSLEPGSRKVVWSEQMLAIHGLPIGPELTLEQYRRIVHPDDIGRVVRTFVRAVELGSKEWSEEYRIRRSDGQTRNVISRCILWIDPQTKLLHVSGVTQDVTEMNRVEDALKRSESRYRHVVESSPDAIILEREDGLFYVNPAGIRLLGLNPSEGLTRFVLKDVIRWRRENSMMTGDLEEEICEVVRPDGSASEVEIAFTDTEEGNVPALLTIIRDVTEARKFMRRARRIQQLSALGEMSATLAHEIRNPLGAISLNFQCLCDEVKTFDEDTHLASLTADIREAIRRIGDIVKTFLDFARPAQPEFKKENIHVILDTALKAVLPDLKHKNIRVIKQYDPDLPFLQVDSTQIVQVFVNLFLNAKDAMPNGGDLEVRTSRDTHTARVEVADSGTGISPENLRRVFEPFFTTKLSGTGLGLAVVQQILNQHNCAIEAVCTEGVGTTFVMSFPLGEELL